MKKTLIFILLGIFILCVTVAVKLAMAIYMPNKGTLRVLSNPQGSVISIDTKQIGTSPYKETVNPGEYTLKLINNVGPNKLSVEKSITVTPDSQTEINWDFGPNELFHSGEILNSDTGLGLIINSEPSGSSIFVDEEPVGTSPVYVQHINPGTHQLRVVHKGYVSRDITVKLVNGMRLVASIYLAREPFLQKPNQLEEYKATSLWSIQTEDPLLLTNTKKWADGIFFFQMENEGDTSKLFTDIIDTAGNHFVNKNGTKKESAKVVGYLSSKSQSFTTESRKTYENLVNKEPSEYAVTGLTIEIADNPTGTLQVREEAELDSQIVGRLKAKDKADVTKEKGDWYLIKSGTTEGWIQKEFTKKL